MFTENSIVAKTWAKAVQNGAKQLAEVPALHNLREIVISIIEGGK